MEKEYSPPWGNQNRLWYESRKRWEDVDAAEIAAAADNTLGMLRNRKPYDLVDMCSELAASRI